MSARSALLFLVAAASPVPASCSGGCSAITTGTGCELACERDAHAHMRGCETGIRDCYLGCDGFDDEACIGACDAGWWECEAGLDSRGCLARCPCWSTFDGCWDGCPEGDDVCLDDCVDAYRVCLGVDRDALAACDSRCAAVRDACIATCNDGSLDGDWPAFVVCESDCYIAAWDCRIACL